MALDVCTDLYYSKITAKWYPPRTCDIRGINDRMTRLGIDSCTAVFKSMVFITNTLFLNTAI